jgi:hypothetical protein
MPLPSAAVRPRVLAAAVSPLTADLVEGPPRPATVLGVHRFGAYLGVHDRVLPVLARDAVALPSALRVAIGSHELAWGCAAGDVVRVGGGEVSLPGLRVRGVRGWRPSRVRPLGRLDASDRSRLLAEVGAVLGHGPGRLVVPVRAAVEAAVGVGADHAVAALVGRGDGLTPAGDDALAGALLLLHALTDPRAERLSGAVRTRLRSTTAVSAALLDAAADGYASPEVVRLVDAVAAGDLVRVRSALPPVLAHGHSSGRDLVAGVAAALAAHVPSGRVAA